MPPSIRTVAGGARMPKQDMLTEDLLTQLLEEAKAAHAEYEKETGEYDEEWPRWYARYVLDRLNKLTRASEEESAKG
jgi:hypothetical protein